MNVRREVVGLRAGYVRAHKESVHRRLGGDEFADARRVEAAAHGYLDVVGARLIQPLADFPNQRDGHAAALGGGVETNSPNPVAQRLSDVQRVLRLVLERVHQRHARDSLRYVAVEELNRPDRIAQDERQSVRHVALRRDAGESSADGGRA